jgi:flagellar hook-associated protein 1 FlgK
MSILGSILGSVRTALTSHQVAMQTVSHNIANAETEGYSRQRAELNPLPPVYFAFGAVGIGVDVNHVRRQRDTMLDASYRRDAGNASSFGLRHDLMAEVESVLGEPSDTGLSATLDAFWSSWSDLSNNPGNGAAQTAVRQRGAQVAYTLNGFATRLDEITNRSRERLVNTVAEVNRLSQQIADLNGRINAVEASVLEAPDLRDQLDGLADRLSQLAGTRAEMQKDGSVSIYMNGMALVSGVATRALEVKGGVTPQIGFVGDPDALQTLGGELDALVGVINTDVPSLRTKLDELARGIVNGVNEYHMSGWTAAGDALGNANWNPLLGATGSRVAFFDTTGVSASTIKLSAEVSANVAVIASGDTQNAPGANNVALALAALRDDAGMDALRTRMGANFATQIGFATGVSYLEHYQSTVSGVGVSVSEAQSRHSVFATLAQQADIRRTSVSGVSLDEELTLMMRHQQAYVAATRMVHVADEMAQAVINLL